MPHSTPTRCLTDDEPIFLERKGVMYPPVRVRIWRGNGQAPIVLASWPNAFGKLSPIPPWALSKLANLINSGFLGFPSSGFTFFELCEDTDGQPVVAQVVFSFFGRLAQRLKAYNPVKHAVSTAFFEQMFGGAFDWSD